jgi:glycosyltransferase involved in cell wall biosynthesis
MTTIDPRGQPATARRLERGVRRIAIVAPPWVPVPPPAYGGIEVIVALQAQVLAQRGYEVTLIAAPGSGVDGVRCVTPLDDVPPTIGNADSEWEHALAAYELTEGHDVIVDHMGALSALVHGEGATPVLHVTHGELHELAQTAYTLVARRSKSVRYVAISRAQRDSAPELPFIGVCHNAIDCAPIPHGDGSGGYLAFLGRMAPEKGATEAIEIARRAGVQLRIAAKCREPDEERYFDEHVAPHLGDDVVWLGEIGAEEKYELLGDAAALVFPISWPEPFGMVMVESMACGTPVLATPCGAVPEVVRDGVTGVIGALDDLVAAVPTVGRFSREACRAHVETAFGPERYLASWESVLARVQPPG